ncbi:class I SAM-dependent methyltransferase [bacterium]|nr:class I SAM-dependent methyltransferase [bacterium]
MKNECDSMWSKEFAAIRKYSPSYYMSNYYLRRFLKNMRGNILDVGSGDCSKVKLLGKGKNYMGIDISEVAVDRALEQGYQVRQGDVTKLNFKSHEFDCVLAVDILEHVKDDNKMLQELYRVLKPGGSLFLTTVLHQNMWGPLDVDAGHYKRYEPEELMKMFKRTRWRSCQQIYVGFPFLNIYREFQYFIGRILSQKQARGNKNATRCGKYIPRGILMKLYQKTARFILPLFHFDRLFSWCPRGRGIIIIAKKAEKADA